MMVTTWVLIVMIHWGYGTAATNIEMATEESCKSEMDRLSQMSTSNRFIDSICVKKTGYAKMSCGLIMSC